MAKLSALLTHAPHGDPRLTADDDPFAAYLVNTNKEGGVKGGGGGEGGGEKGGQGPGQSPWSHTTGTDLTVPTVSVVESAWFPTLSPGRNDGYIPLESLGSKDIEDVQRRFPDAGSMFLGHLRQLYFKAKIAESRKEAAKAKKEADD